MRKALIAFIVVIAMIAVFAGTELHARGTFSGTILSNKTCTVLYSNISGTMFSNASTNVTTMVTQGYDLSTASKISVGTQSGFAGGVVTFNFGALTNMGNSLDTISIGVSTNALSSTNWTPFMLWAYTNGAIVASNTNSVSGSIDLSVGANFTWGIDVGVPATVTNGEWIDLYVDVWDLASGGVLGNGDGWPGTNISLFGYSSDINDLRDYQRFNIRINITGPIILLAKTVSTNTIRPFEVMEYEIEYTNVGGAAAYGIIIEDYIPTYTVITQDSAESNNSLHDGTATVEYITNASGSAANSTYDNGGFANRTNIQRVRWTLSSNVGVGDGGRVRFSVMVR